jgi:hypothetical protein
VFENDQDHDAHGDQDGGHGADGTDHLRRDLKKINILF